MKVKVIGVCVAALLLIGAESTTQPTQVPAWDVGTKVVITGHLGVPIGQVVTITGHKKGSPVLRGGFVVDTIDGTAVSARTVVNVDGIRNWPDGTAATLKGSEEGTLTYLYFEQTNASEDDKWRYPQQLLSVRFKISKVIEPAGLKVMDSQ